MTNRTLSRATVQLVVCTWSGLANMKNDDVGPICRAFRGAIHYAFRQRALRAAGTGHTIKTESM